MIVNKTIRTVFRNALADLPGVSLDAARSESRHGAVGVTLNWRGCPRARRLHVLWLHEGWPSDVRRAVAGIPDRWPRDLVVATRRLSPGAIKELRARDANWMDETGNARLIVPPSLFIVKEVKPEQARATAEFAWSSSKIAVAEALLNAVEADHEVRKLATDTGWSAPQISNVLGAFDTKGWTTRHGPPRGSGVRRTVDNPGSLLDAWTEHLVSHRPPRRLGHRLMRDPLLFLSAELAPALPPPVAWAVSGWAGLELTAPYLTVVPALHIYLAGDALEVAQSVFDAAGVRDVDTGANIELWELDVPLIAQVSSATSETGGISVINPARLYADLIALGGRGDEAAQHLRGSVLGF